MTFNNAINAQQTGFQSLTSGGVWNGRTLTAGAGITITNGDGVSGNPTISSFSPNSKIQVVEDFITVTNSAADMFAQQTTWSNPNVQKWGPATSNFVNTHPGLLGGPATTTTYGIVGGSNTQIVLGGGAITLNWVVNVATLSTVTNTYTLILGLGDIATAEPTNGVYFLYTNGTNSGQWVGKTANASSRSSANSANTVSAGSWVNLQIVINAAATSCAFYVNGVQISNSPLAANIPTAAIAPVANVVVSAGTVPAQAVYLDLLYMTIDLTTPR